MIRCTAVGVVASVIIASQILLIPDIQVIMGLGGSSKTTNRAVGCWSDGPTADLATVRVAKSFPEWGHGLQSDVCVRSYGVFREPLQTARHSIPRGLRHDLCRGHAILSPFRFGSIVLDILGQSFKMMEK